MSERTTPPIESRRATAFTRELRARMRAWVPEWSSDEDTSDDLAAALLAIAGRYAGEVAGRLDRVGDKMARGLLDWLAVRGLAARPARMPVVLKLADTARSSVLAKAPVRLQVGVDDATVVFETEHDVRLVPGKLDRLVAVDPAADAYYLPPPGLTSLDPLEPLPSTWIVKSFAAIDSRTVQLDPPLGLAPGMCLEMLGAQYAVESVNDDLVTVDPPIDAPEGIAAGSKASRVDVFAPFAGSRNAQRHALYLGHEELLSIDAEASIEVINAQSLSDATWQYWGKVDKGETSGWQSMTSVEALPGGVLLKKPKGPIEPMTVDGTESRWIRAVSAHIDSFDRPLLRVDEVELRINPGGDKLACPLPDAPEDGTSPGGPPPLEGFANTMPLVLSSLFYPLGREPRQFDAFYLASTEAFSKPEAKVVICFEAADPTAQAFAVLRQGRWQDRVLASVGKDRALHLFQSDPSLETLSEIPERSYMQPQAEGGGPAIPLDPDPPWRIPIWADSYVEFSIAVTAADTVWVRHERPSNPADSKWESYGTVPGDEAAGAIQGLVHVDAGADAGSTYALRGGVLYTTKAPGTWSKVTTPLPGGVAKLLLIAPVRDDKGRSVTGLIAVADDNLVYRLSANWSLVGVEAVDAKCLPGALDDGGNQYVVGVSDGADNLVLVSANPAVKEPLPPGTHAVLGGSIELTTSGTSSVFALVARGKGDTAELVVWGSLAPGATPFRFPTPAPAGAGFGGAPTVFDGYVVTPGQQADAALARWNPAALIVGSGVLGDGIVVPASVPPLAPDDWVVADDAALDAITKVTAYGLTQDGETFYSTSVWPPATAPGGKQLLAFKTASHYDSPTNAAGTTLALAPGDALAFTDGDVVLVQVDADQPVAHRIGHADVGQLTLVSPIAAGTVKYWHAYHAGGRVASSLAISPPDNMWDAAILSAVPLVFPGNAQTEQRGKAFVLTPGNRPALIALEHLRAAGDTGNFVINAALGTWRRHLGPTSANPELAWEYWNGTSWWTLPRVIDGTSHLKATGSVQFTVPKDIANTDVAGRDNTWIRARLVGGDYGRETVTVKVKDLGHGTTEQTVVRSSADIRAPAVIHLRVGYAVDAATLPMFVLTEDSGAFRDQSDANRTKGAMVEAFVPLALALRRLEDGEADSQGTKGDCGCCEGGRGGCARAGADAAAGTSDGAADSKTAGATSSSAFLRRALFLGFDARLEFGPIRVLLNVEEQPHDGFAPLAVESLGGDRLQPLPVEDTTRALGESGMLTLDTPVPPVPAALFGQARTWLRLRPSRLDAARQWTPRLRGAYLNAVWAQAAETMTREPLGTSDGRPVLTLRVARPPLVQDSLELRVREPLGEEERHELRKGDPERVLSEVQDLPGDWVRWEPVLDTADCGPNDRVYMIDEANGEVRFGTGRHGMIPPIGRDAIVAFRYSRTEPPAPGQEDAPANRVDARAQLGLITSVESVEAAFAADDAAGGAPPEKDLRVIRFGQARLRHRGRAVTLEDLQDIALQSSVDLVQARAFARAGRVRLVVTMRGGVDPTAAQRRELRRILLESASPTLAAPGALAIEAPARRTLRISLRLAVSDLEKAGQVGERVRAALRALFDPGTGGLDGLGWPFGQSPREEDIAAALADVPDLEAILDIRRERIDGKGRVSGWADVLRPEARIDLAQDGVRIAFETNEVVP